MNIKLLTQPKLLNGSEYSLGEQIKTFLLSKRPKVIKATFFFGMVKENAYEELFEDLKSFILNGGELKFYLGRSQKGATKKVIKSLLELGSEVYLFDDEESDFQYKGVMFESKKNNTILLSTGNFSLSGLFESYNMVTEISYDMTDKNDEDEFDKINNSIFNEDILKAFINVTPNNFDEVFYSEIPSIEEFTHKDVNQSEPIITALNDINIDIEIDDAVDFSVAPVEEEKMKKEPKSVVVLPQEKKELSAPIDAVEFEATKYFMDDEALDIENMLFMSSGNKEIENNVKVTEDANIDIEQEDKIEETKIIAKSANLNKTSIFMLQIPKMTKKGASAGEIKIPSYLRDLISAFWSWPKEYKLNKNTNEKERICTFKIIDTLDSKNVILDENVKLFQKEGENSFSILSEKLVELDLHENDILRFIKTESVEGSYFTCEVVRVDAKEYSIWEQFCTSLLKGSKRKYGMM